MTIQLENFKFSAPSSKFALNAYYLNIKLFCLGSNYIRGGDGVTNDNQNSSPSGAPYNGYSAISATYLDICGTGELSLQGGNGGNGQGMYYYSNFVPRPAPNDKDANGIARKGGDGGSGIFVCTTATINIPTISVFGGNGGKGASSPDRADINETIEKTETSSERNGACGFYGFNGGDGGASGKAFSCIYVQDVPHKLIINEGCDNIYFRDGNAGDGGNGGQGSIGYKGGNGKDAVMWGASATNGASGGMGGSGGRGGNSGWLWNIASAYNPFNKTLRIYSGEKGIVGTGGAGGVGGAGGIGGDKIFGERAPNGSIGDIGRNGTNGRQCGIYPN